MIRPIDSDRTIFRSEDESGWRRQQAHRSALFKEWKAERHMGRYFLPSQSMPTPDEVRNLFAIGCETFTRRSVGVLVAEIVRVSGLAAERHMEIDRLKGIVAAQHPANEALRLTANLVERISADLAAINTALRTEK